MQNNELCVQLLEMLHEVIKHHANKINCSVSYKRTGESVCKTISSLTPAKHITSIEDIESIYIRACRDSAKEYVFLRGEIKSFEIILEELRIILDIQLMSGSLQIPL